MRDVLRGVKVVEVAQWWFGPSAAAVLSEWGADVIKVEHPVLGDPVRALVTGGLGPANSPVNFMVEQSNHGKRSIGLDITTEAGRAILDELIVGADVFLTSFLPQLRKRLRIDVDDVRAVNPSIVYAKAHGSGALGPESERPGFDAVSFWARGGVAHHLTPEGAESPLFPRPSFGDGMSGMALAGGIAAALYGRERHGEPSVIDVSLLGTAAWVMGPDVVAASVIPGGLPHFRPRTGRNPLSNCYKTSDGRWVWLSMLQSDRFWPDFCHKIGRPDLADDPRFSSQEARAENLAVCLSELDATFASRTLQEWKAALVDLEGAWAPVQSATDLLDDPQVLANDYVVEAGEGESRHHLVPNPARFDGVVPEMPPAPGPGEHTDEILAELDRDWDQIIELKIAGIVN